MKINVDASFCISLRGRDARQQSALRSFSVLDNKTDFWLVDKDIENPERGCYNSHRDIALYGLSRNLERVLVLEDDVRFDKPPSSRQIEAMNRHLQKNIGDLFYLGGLLGDIWLTNALNIAGCHLFCTHAYVINRSGMKKLASLPYSGMPIDVLFKLSFAAFTTFPMIASQFSSQQLASDISQARGVRDDISDAMWKKNYRSQYLSLLRNIARIERI